MARLYEHQGKALLAKYSINIPKGKVITNLDEAIAAAKELGYPVVVKMQVWTTGRAALGGVKFANDEAELIAKVKELLGVVVKGFPVTTLLIEEKLDIKQEFFAGVVLSDAHRAPVIIFSSVGGTGIEEIAKQHPDKVARFTIDITKGLRIFEARQIVKQTGIDGKAMMALADVLVSLYQLYRQKEARSVEINPLVITATDKVYAADCHIAIDDYAVFRHPELEIEIARELDHPATPLEKVAFKVESNDYRGTFYFFQVETQIPPNSSFVGFHGAGGGGSMMSMDALNSKGFKIANFCDTSGNPPASKVYRAAKIILSQPNIVGYFASGSGVASQEQFHSARGFAKAFHEVDLHIPAVIRLGGNQEEKAIQILTDYCKDLNAKVEGYGKNDSAVFCAERLKLLVDEHKVSSKTVKSISNPDKVKKPYVFETITGKITFDHAKCINCTNKVCISECVVSILQEDENGCPVLNISLEEAKKGKCRECLACELECWALAKNAVTIELPLPTV